MNIKLLRQKNFFLLIMGKLVSLLGSGIQSFALSLYVLKITGSAAQFASVLSITIIPRLLLGPVVGVIVDWFDRKKIVVWLDMFNGAIIGLYAIIFLTKGCLSMMEVYILSILLSFVSLVFQPAISTILPSIVDKEELVDANSINSLVMNMGNLIAPMISGVLFARYGLFIVLVVNSISFMLSSISEMFINVPKIVRKPSSIGIKRFRQDFSEGISFLISRRTILIIMILACIANFAYSPISAIGLVFISKQVLKVTDVQYGLLQSITVVSMLVAPFLMKGISGKIKIGRIMFLDIFLTGILVAFMAVIPTKMYMGLYDSNMGPYISLAVVTFLIGMIISIGSISMNTMFQREIPLEIMGRANTVMSSLSMASIPLGQMLFGMLFDTIQPWVCILITSIIYLTSSLMFRKSLCEEKSISEKEIYAVADKEKE